MFKPIAYCVGWSNCEAMQSLIGGMSQAIDPQLLQPTQYAFGLNVTDRKGLPRTRPGFTKAIADIPDGKFQGAVAYILNDDNRIVFAVSGTVYQLKLSDMSIITHTGSLSATVDRMYFCQADRYFIVQDGDPSTSWASANWPVIIEEDDTYDQSALRASSPEEALPKGADMAYGHGRLFVSTNYVYEAGWSDNLGRVGFVAGDIIKAFRPEDVLSFTENVYLNEGGRVIMPEELGYINGMGFQKNIMTGIGAGPLIVGAERGFSSFQVNAPRAQWKNIDFGIVLFSGKSIGCMSPSSWQNHNSDIFYRSKDGIRTLKDAATKAQGSSGLVNDPISNEVQDILSLDDEATLKLVECAILDDRVFTLSAPTADKLAFYGVTSLDFKPIGSISGSQPPIYDGIWTGFEFMSLVSARKDDDEKLFAFVRKSTTETELFFFDESAYQDNASDAPLCRVYTGYKFFNSAFQEKKFKYLELFLSEIKGDVRITGYYRSDNYPFWNKITESIVKSDPAGASQRRTRLRLTAEAVDDDPALEGRLDTGSTFQFCIEWQGFCQLDRVKFIAEDMQTQDFYLVDEEASAVLVSASADAVDINDYTYEVTL